MEKKKNTIQYDITLLPSVSTVIARGMFRRAKYTHLTVTLDIKHLITTTAKQNKNKEKTNKQKTTHKKQTKTNKNKQTNKKQTKN